MKKNNLLQVLFLVCFGLISTASAATFNPLDFLRDAVFEVMESYIFYLIALTIIVSTVIVIFRGGDILFNGALGIGLIAVLFIVPQNLFSIPDWAKSWKPKATKIGFLDQSMYKNNKIFIENILQPNVKEKAV